MARVMTKSQRAKQRRKKSKNKVKKLEKQDSLGISRKEVKNAINEKTFIILKIISILLIPTVYLIYSPLLIFAVIFSACMMIFARMCENKINHTFIKKNHIKIPKIDSIVAIIVIIVTFAGALINANSKKKVNEDNIGQNIFMSVQNIGSCLTGNRSIISLGGIGMHFGTKDFDPDKMPSMKPKEKPSMEDFSFDDLPLDIVFSHMISSVNTVLLFLIPYTGLLSLVIYIKKKKKYDKEMNEVIIDSLPILTDEKLDELFSFGYELDASKNSN